MYCRHCGKENKDLQKFCKYCGENLTDTETVCLNCGGKNKIGKRFCKFCGINLLTTKTEQIEEPYYGKTKHEDVLDDYASCEVTAYDEIKHDGSLVADAKEDYENGGEDEEDIELWTISDDNLSRKSVRDIIDKKNINQNMSKSAKRKKSRNSTCNGVLVGLIVTFTVILIVLGLILASYFKTGTFSPIALFRSEESIDFGVNNQGDNDETDEKSSESTEVTEPTVAVEPEKETETVVVEEQAESDLFSKFLAGNVTATVAEDFQSNSMVDELEPGKEYSISAIRELIEADYKEGNHYLNSIAPSIYYARLSISGETIYALKYLYTSFLVYNTVEGENHTFIIRENNGELEIKFAVWELFRDKYGNKIKDIVNNEGIAKYGVYGDSGDVREIVWAPDKNFTYREIYKLQSNIAGTAGYYDSDESSEGNNNEPMEPLHTIAWEACQGNEDAKKVVYYKEIINGDSYYYYLGNKDYPITQEMVDYIDAIAASYGFGFDGKAAADEARTAYEKELDVYDACQNQTEPQWTEYRQ